MDPFKAFMRGLMADARLARAIPATLAEQTPEVVVLTLAQALANATERSRGIHPAFALLEEIDAAEVRR
jgi:hypothetical protein